MVCEDKDLYEQYMVPHWKPMQVRENGGDMIAFLGVSGEMGSGILDT